MSDLRQARLDSAQATGRLTSVVAAVMDRYGVVWAGASGDCPGVGGQYRIGSITKTMTAALVMQLRDEGLVALDDPVGRHLGPVGYAEATLRELLAHTSGMQSEPTGPWWERTPGRDFASLVAANDGSGRVAAPGEYFHYSNLGYALLGEVVARRTGRPWRQVLQERLLWPLGMRHTSYLPRPHAQPGWSVHHFTDIRSLEPLTDTGAMAPAGQLWSTLGDLVLWGQFLAGARPDVLAPETLAEMAEPTTDDYGLGLQFCVSAAGRMVGHSGSMPGFLASVFVDPVTGIGGALLCNATTGIEQQRLLLDLIEGESEEEEVPPPWEPTLEVPAPARGVPGLWFWGNTAIEMGWRRSGLQLREVATGRDGSRFELYGDRLVGVSGYHRGEVLEVHRRPDGAINHLECATFVYTAVPYDPAAPIPGGPPG